MNGGCPPSNCPASNDRPPLPREPARMGWFLIAGLDSGPVGRRGEPAAHQVSCLFPFVSVFFRPSLPQSSFISTHSTAHGSLRTFFISAGAAPR